MKWSKSIASSQKKLLPTSRSKQRIKSYENKLPTNLKHTVPPPAPESPGRRKASPVLDEELRLKLNALNRAEREKKAASIAQSNEEKQKELGDDMKRSQNLEKQSGRHIKGPENKHSRKGVYLGDSHNKSVPDLIMELEDYIQREENSRISPTQAAYDRFQRGGRWKGNL